MTSEERAANILYWWCVTIQIWAMILPGWIKLSTNQKHCLDLGSDVSSCTMEFQLRFLKLHFAGKPMMASRNVGVFLMLRWTESAGRVGEVALEIGSISTERGLISRTAAGNQAYNRDDSSMLCRGALWGCFGEQILVQFSAQRCSNSQ